MRSIGLKNASRLLRAAVAMVLGSALVGASGQTWVRGDVFIGTSNGEYDVFSNQGLPKGSVYDLTHNAGFQGVTYGCAFNKDLSKLYTTDAFLNAVEIYDGTGTAHTLLGSIDTSFAGADNLSVAFNQAGNYFVGHDQPNGRGSQAGIAEFAPDNNEVTAYFPPLSSHLDGDANDSSIARIDLSSDQTTLFFTNHSKVIKRYDLLSRAELPDFGTISDYAQGLRLLPPFDGSGGVLIAAGASGIFRLDSKGSTIQTYTADTGDSVFDWNDVALDPNGKSFWATDYASGEFFRINLVSGITEVGPVRLPASHIGLDDVSAICVRGGTEGPDITPPVITLSEALPGPPKQVLLESYDGQSGLATIVVNHCNNCTAATDGFTAGTNNIITTTATKTDPTKSSSIEITATDVAGNKTTFDPVDLTLESEGYPTVHNIRILSSEHVLVISNGAPGMSEIELMVNGRVLPEIKLRDRESKTIDLAEYMGRTEKSEVRMKADGKVDATAWLVFTEP